MPLVNGTPQDSTSKALNQLAVNNRNLDTLTPFARREMKRLLMKEAKLGHKSLSIGY